MTLIPQRASLFDKLTGLFLIRKVTGAGRVNTTLSGNVAAAATTLALTSAADAQDKDILLVGSGEEHEALVQSGAPSGSNVTVFTGAKRAHVTGEAVTEGVAYDMGEVAQVSLLDSAERADMESDISRSPYGTRLGFMSFGIAARLPSLDADHLAIVLGLPFTKVRGAGTAANPTQLFTDGDDLGREPTFVVATAIDEQGDTIYTELDACDADYTQVQLPLSQAPETGLNLRLIARAHGRWVKGLPNFVRDATKRITRAQYPEALVDGGFFELDGAGASTTLTAPTTVNGNTLVCSSIASITGGVWLLVEGGGKSQIVWVESAAVSTATLRIETAYVFPIGSTVKALKITRPGGFREGSTQFTVGGSTRPVRHDQSRVQQGVRPGRARFSLGFAPTAFTLETLRRRLGLPTGAVVGSVLTVSDLVGTDAPIGAFVRVQRKDGKNVWIILNTVDNTIASLEMALGMADMWSVPLEHVGLQMQYLQY